MSALWERQDFRRATGDAWRPGGIALTSRALDWCAANGLLKPGALVVDFGCGAGASLELLAGRGYRALGLDKNAGRNLAGEKWIAGTTAETVPELAQPWGMVQADVSRPPLAAGRVDGVLCECVLSLLENPFAAMRAAHEALCPGGVLILSDLTQREGCEAPGSSGARGSSCLAGARPVSFWSGLAERAGFLLLHYEDNSRALVELAARMIWYGEDAGGPLAGLAAGGAACSCSGSSGSGLRSRAYGYGLWIARKEAV